MDAQKKTALVAKTKKLAVLTSILAVLAVVLYFVGLSQGRSQVADVVAQRDQALAELTQTQAERAHAQHRSRMMHALAMIYQTALDLDERNFGTANERLKEAAGLLTQVDAAVASDPVAFTQLTNDLRQANLRVAADLRQQRASIFAFGQQLSALIPMEATPAGVTSSADETSGEAAN